MNEIDDLQGISAGHLLNMSHLHKVRETFGDVIKELGTRTDHDALWNGIDLRLHLEIVVALERDQQDSKVGAAQVQRQELALLCKGDTIILLFGQNSCLSATQVLNGITSTVNS